MTPAARGMYGVRITGLKDCDSLGTVPQIWPEWSVTVGHAAPDPDQRHEFATTRTGLLRFGDGSTADTTRVGVGGSVDLRLARDVDECLLAHPYLAAVGMFSALWGGRLPLHAGAVDVDGQAWLIVATKGGGKSTTLALLERLGHRVLSDDLAIIDEELNVHRGPRFIDLRRDTARVLGIGTYLGVLGARERWRHTIGDAPLTLPLAGIIDARWGDPDFEHVRGIARIEIVAGSIALSVPGPWDELFMTVVERVPVYSWTRPKDPGAFEGAVENLARHLAQLD